jgi:hypothetical protein
MDFPYYKLFNDDLKNMNNAQLSQHYRLHGCRENRMINKQSFHQRYPEFDVGAYRENNRDLQHFQTEYELIKHFWLCGRFEKRVVTNVAKTVTEKEKYKTKITASISECKNIFPPHFLENQNSSFLEYCIKRTIEISSDINLTNSFNEIFKGLFDVLLWLRGCINQRRIVCLNPFEMNEEKKEISTDVYSISAHSINYEKLVIHQPSLFVHYHFVKEKCILGFHLGVGMNAMDTSPLYFYSYEEDKLWYNHYHLPDILLKLNEIIDDGYRLSVRNDDRKKSNGNNEKEKNKIILLVAGHANLGHQFWNEMTGFHLLENYEMLEKTDEVMFGNYDYFGMDQYITETYKKQCLMIGDLNSLNEFRGCGVFYSYHFMKITSQFLSFYKKKFLPTLRTLSTFSTQLPPFNDIENKILIVLRREATFDNFFVDKIVSCIQMLRAKNLSLKFIFEGYFRNFSKEWKKVYSGNSTNSMSGSEMMNNYKDLVNVIVNKSCLTNNDYRSTIGMYVHEALSYHNNILMTLSHVGSAATIAGWIDNIPGIQFGRAQVEIYEGLDKVIYDSPMNMLYIPILNEDHVLKFYTDQVISKSVVCSIINK